MQGGKEEIISLKNKTSIGKGGDKKHTNKILCFTLKLKSLYPRNKYNLEIYPSTLQINYSTGPCGPL